MIAFLLVTCCREPSRTKILKRVVSNLQEQAPELKTTLTVLDNASTEAGVRELLTNSFDNVYQTDRNVGYWTAIDWWLSSLRDRPPAYVYIIESDMMHRCFSKVWTCGDYLDQRPLVGGVRLHEYSVTEKHLYDKDRPVAGSKRHAWRSHTNTVTGRRIELEHDVGEIWSSNFNVHLPGLNRYDMLCQAFDRLRTMPSFTEHDLQRVCHEEFQAFSILDGGTSYELAYNGSNEVGSFLPQGTLQQMGYQNTRASTIVAPDQYTVCKL